MLDKFKFFKDRDKHKDKDKSNGAVKSPSKCSSSSASTSSDAISRTSGSDSTTSSFHGSHSSSSADHEEISVCEASPGPASSGTTTSSNSSKSGKRSKAFSSKKDVLDDKIRSEGPPPIPSAVGLGPLTFAPHATLPVPSSSCHKTPSPRHNRKSGPKPDRSDDRHTDARLATVCPVSPSSRTSSTITGSNSISKTQSPSSSSSKSSKRTSSTATSTPTSPLISSTPTSSPSTHKLNFSKSPGRLSKMDKSRVAVANDDLLGANGQKSSVTLHRPSSSTQHQQQHDTYQKTLQQLYHKQQAYQLRQHAHHHYHQVAFPLHPQQELAYTGHPHSHAHAKGNYLYNQPQGYTPPYADNPGYATPTRVQTSPVAHNLYPKVNVRNVQWQQHSEQQLNIDQTTSIASQQHRTVLQASNYVPVTSSSFSLGASLPNTSQTGPAVKQMLLQGFTSPTSGRHSLSVNVVKPTVSRPTAASSMKTSSDTQTNLSVIHRSAKPMHISSTSEPTPYHEAEPDQNSSTAPTPSSFASANESVSDKPGTLRRTSDFSNQTMVKYSTHDKDNTSFHKCTNEESMPRDMTKLCRETSYVESTTSVLSKLKDASITSRDELQTFPSTSSPRQGIEKLGDHMYNIASNVAVVQPHSGDKMETTFDTEVLTDALDKLGQGHGMKVPGQDKEIKFLDSENNEKTTTFVDDSGEPMDIKPMPPILRKLPYGYFRGYTGKFGLNSSNYQTPGVAVPITTLGSSTTNGVLDPGMPRPFGDQGPAKYYGDRTKGPYSSSCPNSGSSDPDYASESDTNASESDTCDNVSGYMSDGDLLKTKNHVTGGPDEWTSGYLSEGGASLYARRLQQRFREGMQAVRECMQKSSGLTDDDSFDDSSSISSGDVNDTITDVSADENLTGSSLGAASDDAYSCLNRVPTELHTIDGKGNNDPSSPCGVTPLSSGPIDKRVPSAGTSSFMVSDFNNCTSFGTRSSWGKKQPIQQPGALTSSDPSNYVWPSSTSDSGVTSTRKMSDGSNQEYSYHSEGDYDSSRGCSSPGPGMTKDSETNTDQSHLLEISMRRLQTVKSGSFLPAGMQFVHRKSLTGASNPSGGNATTSDYKGQCQGPYNVERRLTRNSADNGQRSIVDLIPRPASAMDRPINPDVILMENYNSSSLDRKRASICLNSSKSTSCTQTDRDVQSNSLGRLRLFSNKGNLSQGEQRGYGSPLAAGAIISNPHATYSRDKPASHYVNLEELQARVSSSSYAPLEFSPSHRNSISGSPSGSLWLKSSMSSNGVGFPVTPSPLSPHHFHGHAMSDSETYESLANPQLQAQLQARALANARMLAHHTDMTPLSASPPSPSQYLRRSNSIKSDSPYSNAKFCSLNEDLPACDSFSHPNRHQQPETVSGSLTISQLSRFTCPMVYGPATDPAARPIVRSSTQSSLPYSHGYGLSRRTSRDEDESLDASSLSLVSSSSSSVFSSPQDKRAHEVRQLKRDLLIAQEKVLTLTNQLSTNAHVVSAFEQSLSNMTARLQSLTHNSDNKPSLPDTELNDLRITIEALKRQSKMTLQEPAMSGTPSRRHTTPGMRNINIVSLDAHFARQRSSDSVSSINSLSSAGSRSSQQSGLTDGESTKTVTKQAKKKGWLRTSFSKAFSRKKTKSESSSGVEPDYFSLRSNASAPNSPLLQYAHIGAPSMKGSHSSGALCENDVNALKQALRDKDMKLTDIRLEALSSAHQLEQLRETMTKMKNEMCALKADNDRLHKMMSTSQSTRTLNMALGPVSPHHTRSSTDSLDRSFSLTDHSSLDVLLAETAANDRDGKRVTISVVLGSNPNPARTGVDKPSGVLIGTTSVSGKTKWDNLDNAVGKTFKEYVLRVDPVTNLGLSAESIYSYVVGEVTRSKEYELPELLPIGYFVGDTSEIEICLKGTRQSCVDSLAFETMIPKTIVQRYVSLLLDHHRVILCGPSGTGKTYLAQKLAEHVVLRSGTELTAGSVATFNVDHKSAQDLKQYLANIAEQCENTDVQALPSVIILDNLHHVTSLADVFNGFMSVKYQKCLYIIGTMSQSSCSTTNLQIHHNFRFVSCANHMEVKSLLGRCLRRRLIESEIRTGVRNNDLNQVVDWVPKVWAHLNKTLEMHSLADVTIGPRLFMSCPMDTAGSQVWFTDLWNYTLVEAVRDILQMYGCQSTWDDPTDWVQETYPWPNRGSGTSIMHIRVDDLEFEQQCLTPISSMTSHSKSPVKGDKDGGHQPSQVSESQNKIQDFSMSQGLESVQ